MLGSYELLVNFFGVFCWIWSLFSMYVEVDHNQASLFYYVHPALVTLTIISILPLRFVSINEFSLFRFHLIFHTSTYCFILILLYRSFPIKKIIKFAPSKLFVFIFFINWLMFYFSFVCVYVCVTLF